MSSEPFSLVCPALGHLPSYVAALERGWSPSRSDPTLRATLLSEIERSPRDFLAQQEDREGKRPPVELPDGTFSPRLPGFHRWMWDGEFCGQISMRWQPGTTDLPPTCLGHIGYNVVPWKRRRGCATRALALMLPLAREMGLPFVEVTTDPHNIGSQRVIEANGGVLVEEFTLPEVHGGTPGLRYRIDLQ